VGSCSSSCTPAENRTVCLRCRVQYSGDLASLPVIQVPVTFEMNGMVGAFRVTLPTSAAKAPSAGSIIAEWNACEVSIRRTIAPRADIRVSNTVTAASVPATTQSAGPFTAARDNSVPRSGISSASGIPTAAIAPAGNACISRPRAATRRSASSSENTPARQAATYSPTL